MAKRDKFSKEWITENAINICARYAHGALTLRGLHYQLVAIGMTNSLNHYKRVVGAMIDARWEGLIAFEQFSDHDRETLGETEYEYKDFDEGIDQAKQAIKSWMTVHYRNRWENQPIIPEVWIEKKALQGQFRPTCQRHDVALAPCKGYPSLTFLNEAAQRFDEVAESGKKPIILYFGDYDASGQDIPRSIGENLSKLCSVAKIEVKVYGLNLRQVRELGLPPAPTKSGDSRAANWDGIGQVELDAVDPAILQRWCKAAILEHFDEGLHEELMDKVEEEKVTYKAQLQAYVNTLAKEDADDDE